MVAVPKDGLTIIKALPLSLTTPNTVFNSKMGVILNSPLNVRLITKLSRRQFTARFLEPYGQRICTLSQKEAF